MKAAKRPGQLCSATAAFASRLRELRAAAGITQYALAKQANLTPQAIYQLEAGRCQPRWDTVLNLATALGATPDDFVLR
jgi:DNA-binding XRE family transcriptional regulator